MIRLVEYRPPRIAMALVALAALVHFLSRLQPVVSFPLAGLLVAGFGFAVMMRAWWLFRLADNGICPTAATAVLITQDIYRVTRHPMYLGMVMMLAGLALYVGSWPFYLAALANFLILNGVFCPYEEQKLQRAFGEAYRAYRSRVRRWL